MDASAETVSTALLAWYDQHARTFPWRSLPGTPPADPYRVWLSEVMLQQTTTAAVGPYFTRFLARWPSVEALAASSDADLMAAWAGLGYYARARNLLACARAIVARGGFPATEAELRALPGLGPYTAAAVAAIAFGQQSAVVDANVERVMARFYAIADPLTQARRVIRARVAALVPAGRPGDFAQAMMDLGATVCTARTPRCMACPLASSCAGKALGPTLFPVKPEKQAKPKRRGQAYWIAAEGKVWLVRRAAKGLLGGMRALPDDGWRARVDGAGTPPLKGPWSAGGLVRHVFTHFELELHLRVYSGRDWASLDSATGEWWPLDRIEQAGLPTLFAKAARLVTA